MKRIAWFGGNLIQLRFALLLQMTVAGAALALPAAQFDATQWVVKKTLHTDFGPQLPDATVSLLASKLPSGQGSLGEPVFTANIVVNVGDTVVYALKTAPIEFDIEKVTDIDVSTYYVDDLVELADVTGDDIPEIVFHTGWLCADNELTSVHFLQYVGGGPQTVAFRDIQRREFTEDRWGRLAWLKYAGHALTVVAVPGMPYFKNPEDWYFQCPRHLTYYVYEWDRAQQRMVHRGTIPHTNAVHDTDGDPFQDERRYLLQHLRRIFPPRPLRTEGVPCLERGKLGSGPNNAMQRTRGKNARR